MRPRHYPGQVTFASRGATRDDLGESIRFMKFVCLFVSIGDIKYFCLTRFKTTSSIPIPSITLANSNPEVF